MCLPFKPAYLCPTTLGSPAVPQFAGNTGFPWIQLLSLPASVAAPMPRFVPVWTTVHYHSLPILAVNARTDATWRVLVGCLPATYAWTGWTIPPRYSCFILHGFGLDGMHFASPASGYPTHCHRGSDARLTRRLPALVRYPGHCWHTVNSCRGDALPLPATGSLPALRQLHAAGLTLPHLPYCQPYSDARLVYAPHTAPHAGYASTTAFLYADLT